MISKVLAGLSLASLFSGVALAAGDNSAAENMARRRIAYITANLVEYADLALENMLPASRDNDLANAGLGKEWAHCLDLASEAARSNTLYGDGTQQGADSAFYAEAHRCFSRLDEPTLKKLCGVVLSWD